MAGTEDSAVIPIMLRMIDELKRTAESNDNRMRELTTQFHSQFQTLNTQMAALNANLERHNRVPERLEKVERFIWAGTLVVGFVGVVLGGVGQRLIADAVSHKDPIQREEYQHVRPAVQPPPPRTDT